MYTIYRYMTVKSKNVYIDKLNDIVDNIYHKNSQLMLSQSIEYNVGPNDKKPNFKVNIF